MTWFLIIFVDKASGLPGAATAQSVPQSKTLSTSTMHTLVWIGVIFASVFTILTMGTNKTVAQSTLEETVQISDKKLYNGYQLWEVMPQTIQQTQMLQDLCNNVDLKIDVWHEPSATSPAQFLVSPSKAKHIRELLAAQKLRPRIVVAEMQKHIESVQPTAKHPRQKRMSTPNTFNIAEYHNYADIREYMKALQDWYPQLARHFSIGHTFENRSIDGIMAHFADRVFVLEDVSLVSLLYSKQVETIRNVSNRTTRGIWLDAGIHAREWITPAVAVYFMNKLVEEYATNELSKHFVDHLTWYVVPVLNPDGYEYTMHTDRLWRKNRKQNSDVCFGTDLNRNFNSGWSYVAVWRRCDFLATRRELDICSDVYHGSHAFSELETEAVRDFLLSQSGKIDAFLSLHAAARQWLYPFSYRHNTFPSDVNELHELASLATSKIATAHGTQYGVGVAPQLLQAASGVSFDWAKAIANVKYTYAIELRTKDSDRSFVLSRDLILPTAREAWTGIAVVAERILSDEATYLLNEAAKDGEAAAQVTHSNASSKTTTLFTAFAMLVLAHVSAGSVI